MAAPHADSLKLVWPRRAFTEFKKRKCDVVAFPWPPAKVGCRKYVPGGDMSLQEKPASSESSLADLKAALAERERDLAEARERELATAEVLKAISASSFDLTAVLDKLIESACRLCEADLGTIRHHDGDSYRLAATYGCLPEWRALFASYSTTPHPGSVFGQTIIKGGTVHIPDLLADPDYARPEAQKMMGLRTALGVPLLRQGR